MPSLWTGMSSCLPTTSSCVTAAGRYVSAATSSERLPILRRLSASLAPVVVLPEPCKPDQHDDVRRRAGQVQLGRLAQRLEQLLVDDLDDLLCRGEALQ